jgi:flagella basal body P-ring formation protein FlgA
MKQLVIVMAAMVAGSPALADADRLCQTARSAVEQLAAERGWQADVRCRGTAGKPVVAGAVLQAAELPQGTTLRSGPTTWGVRVQVPGAPAYVQRVPLNVVWNAPAWVSRRDLAPGLPLREDDVELQSRRWPDGVAVTAARDDAPLSGRLRQGIRAGELVTAAQLLPADARVRGDQVTVVLAEGAMEIRMPAQLLAPARVGERARVQVAGRPAALEGLLADAQTVKVGSP